MTIVLFLLRRLTAMVVLLVIVSFAVFGLVSLTPGGPEQTLGGPGVGTLDPASIEAIRKMYDLDQSFFPRYLHWLQAAAHLDFGHSVPDREPVMQMISARLPITLELGAMTLVIVVLIGIPAGMLAARRRGGAGRPGHLARVDLRRKCARVRGRDRAHLRVRRQSRVAAGVRRGGRLLRPDRASDPAVDRPRDGTARTAGAADPRGDAGRSEQGLRDVRPGARAEPRPHHAGVSASQRRAAGHHDHRASRSLPAFPVRC